LIDKLLGKVKVLLYIVLFIGLFVNCKPNQNSTDEQAAILAGLLVASTNLSNSDSNSATRTPTTSCNTVKGSPTSLAINNTVTHTIVNKDLCYFTFVYTADRTFFITLTPVSNTDSSSSNTDLAVVTGTTGGNKPASTWSGTGTNCTSFGWESCVSNSGLAVETINYDLLMGTNLIIGVYGFDCGSLEGCKFSLRYQ
jgi:hypothetical protein